MLARNGGDGGIDTYWRSNNGIRSLQIKLTNTKWFKVDKSDKNLRSVYSAKGSTEKLRPDAFMIFVYHGEDENKTRIYDIRFIWTNDLVQIVSPSKYNKDQYYCNIDQLNYAFNHQTMIDGIVGEYII